MRIVIDMQGAQTESRFRGIGRYAMSFARAMIRNRGSHEVILVLSGLLPDTIESIRTAFDGLITQDNIRVWQAPGSVKECESGNDCRRQVAELIREAFFASLNPDVIYLTSIFEGYVDDAVTSIGRFDNRTPVAVVMYDLIPLLNPEQYIYPNPSYAEYYKRKVGYLSKASALLAISDFTRQEVITTLKVEDEKVINISSAIESSFVPVAINVVGEDQVRKLFNLNKKFILYTGGSDQRKNLPRLINAYAQLPVQIKENFQMVFAGQMAEVDSNKLKEIARFAGLNDGEIVFTGYVNDEQLIQLYCSCELYVFPSWHEGFGLPALEAMACGAIVIASNTTSLPEVIGIEEALFDPMDTNAICTKMYQALTDVNFRIKLAEHAAQQVNKFNWDETAKKAIALTHKLKTQEKVSVDLLDLNKKIKPRLAYVSPLPPERTGIADYSAELLPALFQYYDLYIILDQNAVEDEWINEHCHLRDSTWLKENKHQIDRVLYHIGNSPFHKHMLALLQEVPGTLVLHDFYLSGLKSWLELHGDSKFTWVRSLYKAHGYQAVADRFRDGEDTQLKYPVNLDLLQYAQGVITHSEYSRQLSFKWYGSAVSSSWQVIPLLRKPAVPFDKNIAKHALGFSQDDFIICSFGFVDPSKLNHRLLNCWLNSSLSNSNKCYLVFVGENHGGLFGSQMTEQIAKSEFANRIRITGFTSSEIFRQYLMAADLGVQLRAQSRGETSAAVLDCMNYGLPVIVNNNGSMAELDKDSVWLLPEKFKDELLVDALETLQANSERRLILGVNAQKIIHERHNPQSCGEQYALAIESFNLTRHKNTASLLNDVAAQLDAEVADNYLKKVAEAISQSLPLPRPKKRLFLDITSTCRNDLKTGIERVARSILIALLEDPPNNYCIEPVYLDQIQGKWIHRYARRYTLGILGCPVDMLEDEIVEVDNGDILLNLDLSGGSLTVAEQGGLYKAYRNQGVFVYSIVFDLLPVQLPDVFPPAADESHRKWLESISEFDGAVCISKTVANDLESWRMNNVFDNFKRRQYNIDWFHLGSDIESSAPTHGVPNAAKATLAKFRCRPTFLMVGTIEPRKGYLQTLEGFTELWMSGLDVNLVIVGKEGWLNLPDNMRRDIPNTIKYILNHPEKNNRLFWLESISDEYLEMVYDNSTCLIAASYGEGFGLPLIEAQQHDLNIIARDISVFREVAGDSAMYFQGNSPGDISLVVNGWLAENEVNKQKSKRIIKVSTWKESAQSLINVLIRRVKSNDSNELRQKAMAEHLNLIHQARIKMVSSLLPKGDVILDLGGANCPLYKMDYPHKFKKIYVIDLPPEARHDMYKEVVIDPNCDGGEIVIKYGDMTDLAFFDDESVDFVWSGQSIEHVSVAAGERMCRAAFRVLKKGGAFCLDTPNRKLTEIHLKGTGLEFIHPEHCIEYYPQQLRQVIEGAGFKILSSRGICEMPNSISTKEFFYEDFIQGEQITDDVDSGYIQFFHCIKPM